MKKILAIGDSHLDRECDSYKGQDIKLPGLSIDEWKTKKENECQ